MCHTKIFQYMYIFSRSNFTETDNLLIVYDVEYEHALRHFQVGDWGGLVCLGHPCSPADPAGLASVKKFGRQFDVEKWEDLKGRRRWILSRFTEKTLRII